jgi:hypothetical protein
MFKATGLRSKNIGPQLKVIAHGSNAIRPWDMAICSSPQSTNALGQLFLIF